MNKNTYEERCRKHQDRKRAIIHGEKAESELPEISSRDREYDLKAFERISKVRRSRRIFSPGKKITGTEMTKILNLANECPSSCNRQAIKLKVIRSKDEIRLLETLLSGGEGWCDKADKIILIFGEKSAYNPDEIYIPYLDAGTKIQQISLTCAAMGIKCCYISLNIAEENKNTFRERFGYEIFCGAMAVGK
jgi:nitroreductase